MAQVADDHPDGGVPSKYRALSGTVVRGVALAGGGYALTQVLTLAFYIALARLASPSEFGQLAAGMVLLGIGLIYTESGMLSALVYRRDRVEEAAATAVVSTFVGGVALALAALAASPLIGLLFDSDRVGSVAAALSGLLLLRTMSVVPDALLQRRFSFLRRMVVEPLGAIAFGVTAVVLTSNGLGVWGLVIGHYASALAIVLLTWGLARWRPQLRLASFATWRELIAYGRHTIAATTLIRVGEEIPVLLLGRFVGTGPLGQFRYGMRIASLPLAMTMAAASYVIFPALARIAVERDRFRAALVRSLRWMAILAVPAGLLLVPLGESTAALLFGDIWVDAGNAAAALALFAAGRALTSLMVEALKADGRPDVVVRMNFVEIVVSATAMVALLPFGLIGICLGVSVGVIVRATYAFRRASEILGVPMAALVGEIRAPIIAAVAMVAVLFPLETLVVEAGSHATAIGLGLLLAEVALGLLVYAGLIRLLVPGAIAELLTMLRTMRRRAPSVEQGESGIEPKIESSAT